MGDYVQTLIKTLNAENGELFAIIEGRRISLSKCPVKVEIYEISANTPILGIIGYEIRVHHEAKVRCETTRHISNDFMKTISRYEIIGDIQRADGIFERINFDNLNLATFNLFNGSWVYHVTDRNMIEKLLNY